MLSPRWPCWGHAALVFATASALILGNTRASAVVDAHSQTNTVPPTDGVPWDNVGSHNGSTGVYLGDRWALSAEHVGPGDITLLGTTYRYDGISYRLTNSDGTATDLVLFHLASSPPLTNLVLASSSPSIGSAVDMIGCGRISAGPTNVGSFSGFAWTPYTGIKSWGNNKVSGVLQTANGGLGNVTVFPTTFNQTPQTSHEGQLAPQDSGGGAFWLSTGTWQLAGINLYISANDSTNSAALYTSMSYYANIPTYRSQINALVASGAPPFLSLTKSGNNVQIYWPSAATGYRLQSKSNLVNGTWTSLTGTISASGSTNLPATNTMRFFRLSKP
jgi:Trypsin